MKTNVIDAPIFVDLKNFAPVSSVGRRITGERKIAAVMRSAQVNRPSVELKFVFVRLYFRETEQDFAPIARIFAF